jgi:hypothetical protein
LVYHVDQATGVKSPGTVSGIIHKLKNQRGWVIDTVPRRSVDGEKLTKSFYKVRSIHDIPISEFSTNLPEIPMLDVPDDYNHNPNPPKEKKSKYQATHKEKKKKAGVQLPPLGAPVLITRASMAQGAMHVTVMGRYTGTVDVEKVTVGDTTEFFSFGLGADGPWGKSDLFTMQFNTGE